MISIPDRYFIPLLFLLAFVSFLWDITHNICFQKESKSIFLYLFLYFHHLLALFLYFGWLSANKNILIFYCFTVFLIFLHWMTNDQKCVLTQIVNYFCGADDREGFHDIFYFIQIKQKDWFNIFIYSYLIFGFMISVYKIKNL